MFMMLTMSDMNNNVTVQSHERRLHEINTLEWDDLVVTEDLITSTAPNGGTVRYVDQQNQILQNDGFSNVLVTGFFHTQYKELSETNLFSVRGDVSVPAEIVQLKKGFRGLQIDTVRAGAWDQDLQSDVEEEIFRAGRKLAKERVERSVVRVQAMFRSSKAQEEYRRMKLALNQAKLEREHEQLLGTEVEMEQKTWVTQKVTPKVPTFGMKSVFVFPVDLVNSP
ncbi:hypothetical protein RJT34_32303 [Clitoria ternatea]|uniref:Uncharacterized protein n=1 Tax=Clitoria ternatea TaxID=43366 RepID=A0AAN9F3N6_CLITE